MTSPCLAAGKGSYCCMSMPLVGDKTTSGSLVKVIFFLLGERMGVHLNSGNAPVWTFEMKQFN